MSFTVPRNPASPGSVLFSADGKGNRSNPSRAWTADDQERFVRRSMRYIYFGNQSLERVGIEEIFNEMRNSKEFMKECLEDISFALRERLSR